VYYRYLEGLVQSPNEDVVGHLTRFVFNNLFDVVVCFYDFVQLSEDFLLLSENLEKGKAVEVGKHGLNADGRHT
jgi:hypothetical protein